MLKEIGRLLVYYREQKSASVSPISVEDEEDNTAAYDGSHMRRNDCIEMNKKLACLHSHLLQKSAVRIVTPRNEERRVLLHLWIWMITFDSVMKLSISQRRSQSRKSPTRTMRMKTIMLIWMPRPGHDPPNDIYLFLLSFFLLFSLIILLWSCWYWTHSSRPSRTDWISLISSRNLHSFRYFSLLFSSYCLRHYTSKRHLITWTSRLW